MLQECNEPPLHLRRKLLSDRFLLRIRSFPADLLGKIRRLNEHDLICNFWLKRTSPTLATSFAATAEYSNLIHTCTSPSVFWCDFALFQNRIKYAVIDVDRIGGPQGVPAVFFEQLYSRFPGGYVIYTDGSKASDGCGCAFYDPQTGTSGAFKLNTLASIFTCEAVAIREALRYAGTRSEELVVVVTDCRSALLKLSNFCMQANVNHIFIEILEEVYRMKVRGQKVRFVWTRAHVGVTGNEFADSLSNSARRNGLNLDVRLPFTDLYVVAYRQLKAGWQQLYDDARVGNHYRQMNPRIAVKPWFSRFELSRPDIRVINRLRSNHGLCGAYLHRIGLRSSSGCEDCGEEEETLKHIFMDCPIHWLARHQMLNSVGLHLENPLHFDQIIHCNLLSVYKDVCNFIKTITKKI
ncbi:hypothetical protein GE061_007666 [Apolygus lucorum]|uniref:RNase H type-1 domain-containing protein n=1 Tax=Apolygus lucorum TaxID=248454 RepID=A0A8S9WME6_APOLU|nr:hypothetical protein GE061_007666 [Apolygus lucorum]